MARDDLSPLLRDMLYAQQYRLLEDPVGRAVRQAVESDAADAFIIEQVRQRVRRHKVAQAFAGPLLSPRLAGGDLLLGFDSCGNEIRHPKQYLNGHNLVVAGSGSGKTMRARFLVLQMALLVAGLWLFDFRKREFGILRPYLRRAGVSLAVLRGRTLRVNPLQVPLHVAPSAWASRVADLLVLALRLPARAAKLLSACVMNLYREFAIHAVPAPDDRASYPTLFDLRRKIMAARDANPQARHAVIDNLDPVLLSIGSVLRYRRGWTASAMARHRIVFEFGDLAETDKDLLLNTLVFSEFTSRLACGISNVEMDLLIVCDEAARMISCAHEGAGIADLIGLVRGTGVGLDLSVQSSDVLPAVLSNTANKWIGRCGSATDYDTIGASMGLTPEQRRWVALRLEPGTFVAQVGEGDWRHPFLVRIPNMRFEPARSGHGDLPDDAESFQQTLGGEAVIAEEFVNWNPDADTVIAVPSNAPGGAEGLSEDDLRFLKAVIDHPGRPSSTLPRLAGIGPQKAQKVRQRLIDLGYLRKHAVNTGPRGRRAIVLEPLEKAIAVVRSAAATEVRP